MIVGVDFVFVQVGYQGVWDGNGDYYVGIVYCQLVLFRMGIDVFGLGFDQEWCWLVEDEIIDVIVVQVGFF